MVYFMKVTAVVCPKNPTPVKVRTFRPRFSSSLVMSLGFPRGFQGRRLAMHQGRLRRFQRRHIALAICHQIILRRGA